MTKREMMVTAHGLAKNMIGSYSARLSLALRQVWSFVKKGVAKVSTIVKCNFYGSIIEVDTETGEVTGNTYNIKGYLKKFHAAQWNPDSKTWTIGSAIGWTQREMIDALVNRYAVK